MRIDFTPRLFMDPQADLKATKELVETVEILKDSFKSLGIIIKQQVNNNIVDADNFTKAYAKSLKSDITQAFNSLGKRSDELLKNQEALANGQAKEKDILKQITQNELKRKSLSIDLVNAVKNGVISASEAKKLHLELKTVFEEQKQELAKQAEYAKRTEKAMGNLGNIVKGLNKIPIVGQFIQADKVMEDMQKKAAETGDKTKVMAAGFKAIGKSIKDGLLDPLTVLTFIIKSLLDGSTGIAGFRKELGLSYKEAYLLNTEMNAVAAATNDTFITGEKLKKSFSGLAQEMGFIADYGSEALVSMTNLTGKLGMSNKEAAQLTTLSRMQSTNTEAVLTNIGKSVTAMNKQGKTTILLKDVMKEVANASKATAVSLGSNPIKLAEAIVAAKQLGTTLQQMEATADSLLNFETSIEDELKAELLTGKQMNLERARAAALANDMKGLSEEIGKNEEIIGAFASGNRLAQEATAKALGMNREQLASMVYQQEAMKIGAEGVRAKYGEQAYEQLKAQAAQEKFANAVEKLKTVLSSIVQIFSPIIDAIAFLVDNTFVLYGLMGGIALLYLPKIASAAKSFGSSIATAAKSSLGFIKTAATKGMGSAISGIGGDKTKETAEKAAGAGDKAGASGPKAGEGIKNTLKGISSGIRSFNKVKASDILKLAGSALALVALTPAIPALLLLQFVNGKAIRLALAGIGQGLAAIGNALKDPRVMLGLGVATLAIMGLGKALQYAAPAVEAFGKVITSVFNGVATVITAASDGIVKMFGALNNVDVMKLLAIGPALIGIGAGIAALGGGSAIGAIGGVIGGAVGKVGSFLGLTEKPKGPIETLTMLASLADPLQKAASSIQLMASALQNVSSALSGVDTSKLDALNSFASNKATDSAAGGITSFLASPIKAIGSVLGGNEGVSQSIQDPSIDLTPMIAAINEVKAAVDGLMNRPVVVNLDGKKVGSGLVQGSYKIA
jgi:hypothetical protein